MPVSNTSLGGTSDTFSDMSIAADAHFFASASRLATARTLIGGILAVEVMLGRGKSFYSYSQGRYQAAQVGTAVSGLAVMASLLTMAWATWG